MVPPTEIYDYLKLLFARIGKTYSPISGQEVLETYRGWCDYFPAEISFRKQSFIVYSVITSSRKIAHRRTDHSSSKGFIRVRVGETVYKIEDLLNTKKMKRCWKISASLGLNQSASKGSKRRKQILRIQPCPRINSGSIYRRGSLYCKSWGRWKHFKNFRFVQTAFFEGHGECMTEIITSSGSKFFTFQTDLNWMESVLKNRVQLFSFNNPYGM